MISLCYSTGRRVHSEAGWTAVRKPIRDGRLRRRSSPGLAHEVIDGDPARLALVAEHEAMAEGGRAQELEVLLGHPGSPIQERARLGEQHERLSAARARAVAHERPQSLR